MGNLRQITIKVKDLNYHSLYLKKFNIDEILEIIFIIGVYKTKLGIQWSFNTNSGILELPTFINNFDSIEISFYSQIEDRNDKLSNVLN